MSKNALIPTNTPWYKFQAFFRKIFSRFEKKYDEPTQIVRRNNDFEERILLKNQIEAMNVNRELAEKLINKQVSVDTLTASQVDEMVVYFKQYIDVKSNELEVLKKNIVRMHYENEK